MKNRLFSNMFFLGWMLFDVQITKLICQKKMSCQGPLTGFLWSFQPHPAVSKGSWSLHSCMEQLRMELGHVNAGGCIMTITVMEGSRKRTLSLGKHLL